MLAELSAKEKKMGKRKYDEALEELERLCADAENNFKNESADGLSPTERIVQWNSYISGIKSSIYRLKTKNTEPSVTLLELAQAYVVDWASYVQIVDGWLDGFVPDTNTEAKMQGTIEKLCIMLAASNGKTLEEFKYNPTNSPISS